MTLEQLLSRAAAATQAPAALAREVAGQLASSADTTPALQKLAAALAKGLTARWRSLKAEDLACARAALFGLEALDREGDDTRQSMLRAAANDAAAETDARSRYGDGRWRCPRCGSQRIDDEHTGRGEVRFIQLLCDACGAVADGMDGALSLAPWKR